MQCSFCYHKEENPVEENTCLKSTVTKKTFMFDFFTIDPEQVFLATRDHDKKDLDLI